jgi:predicted transcriptional regulator
VSETTREEWVTVGWRVPQSMRWKVKELAARRHTSAEKLMREALRRYLAEEERKEAQVRP